MKWARIENGTVREIVNRNPNGIYHPSLVFVECSDEVKEGFTYINGEFAKPAEKSFEPDISSMDSAAKEKLYKSRCRNAISDMYSITDEIKILRRNIEYLASNGENTDEFEEYNDYIEECLDIAKKQVYGESGSV